MLSYRHAFHAGNFADVLKHSVLTLVLEYMQRKDKGFSYIDSHSGAGMYSLLGDYAQKTTEYQSGIAKVLAVETPPEPLLSYLELVRGLNKPGMLDNYPGSPGIAKAMLRRQDNAQLFELHSTDINYLRDFCQRWRQAQVHQSDGYQGVLSQLPPATRRGVVLIDPPYELKQDYQLAVDTVIKGYRKFSTGTYILWYPVVSRDYINGMIDQFAQSVVRNLLQVEFCQRPDSEGYGMTGTGLFIVNAPWTLAERLREILPFFQQTMGSQQSNFTLNQLIAE